MNSNDMKIVMKLRRDKRSAESRGRQKDVADLCNALGGVLLQAGLLEEALEEHEQEAAICESLNDKMGVAVARRRIGDVHCERGVYDDALRQYVRYLETARRNCSSVDVQRATASIGRTYLLMAECSAENDQQQQQQRPTGKQKDTLAKADKWLTRSLKLVPSLSEVSLRERAEMEARLLLNLGLVCDTDNRHHQARQYFSQALSVASQHSLFDELLRIHDSLAYSCQLAADYTAALTSWREAVQLSERLQLWTARAETLFSMAMVHLTLGDTGSAKKVLYTAYKQKHIGPEHKDKYGAALKSTVRIARAEDELLLLDSCGGGQQLQLSRQMRLHETLADGYSQLAVHTRALNHYSCQLKCAECLCLANNALAPIFTSLAETCRDLHQYADTKLWYQRELAAREGNDREICRTLINLADTELLLLADDTSDIAGNGWDSSCQLYRQAALRAAQAGLACLQAVALRELADTLERHQQTQQAESVRAEMRALMERHGLSSDLEEEEEQQQDDSAAGAAAGGDREDSSAGHPTDPAAGHDSDSHIDLDNLSGVSEDENEYDSGATVVPSGGSSGSPSEQPSSRASLQQQQQQQRGRQLRRSVYKLRRNNKGETQLHVACIGGRGKQVERLLDSGHPVNVRDHSGWLPIHEAANFGHVTVVRALLAAGAAVNDPGGRHCGGTTPLHDAAGNGHVACARALIEAGARVTTRNEQKQLPLHCLRHYRVANCDTMTSQQLCDVSALEAEMLTILREAGVEVPAEEQQQPLQETSEDRQSTGGSDEEEEESRADSLSATARRRSVGGAAGCSQVAMPTEPDSAAELYRSAIRSVGVSALKTGASATHTSRSGGRRKRTPSRQSALVDEQLYDWLDDDLGSTNQARRRRCPSPSFAVSTNHRAASRRPSCPSPSPSSSSPLLAVRSDLPEPVTSPERTSCHLSPPPTLVSSHNSGVEIGRQREPLSVSARDTCRSPPRKRTKQSRLAHLAVRRGGSTEDLSSSSSRTPSPVLARAAETFSATPAAATPVSLRVLVEVGTDKFLVPVPTTVTIDGATKVPDIAWLSEQVSDRYHSKFLLRPFVELLKDGALLSASDPVCDVISGQSDVIESRVLRWHTAPLTERYESACRSLQQPVLLPVKASLSRCQQTAASSPLDLSHLALNAAALSTALRACHRCSSLTALVLRANPLRDSGVQELCRSLPLLPALQLLDLTCVAMSLPGLTALSTVASSSSSCCPSAGGGAGGALSRCSTLLLAFNLFSAAECADQLAALLCALPALLTIDLTGCQLSEAHVVTGSRDRLSRSLCRSRVRRVLLSDNALGATAVDLLLRSRPLSPGPDGEGDNGAGQLQLLALDGSCESPAVSHLAAFAARAASSRALSSLDLSRCRLTMLCVSQLARAMKDMPQLVCVNLSDNEQLCSPSSCQLLLSAATTSCPQLQQLVLAGCSWRTQQQQLQLLDCQLSRAVQQLSALKLLVMGQGQAVREQLVPATATEWRRKWPQHGQVLVTREGDLCLMSGQVTDR